MAHFRAIDSWTFPSITYVSDYIGKSASRVIKLIKCVLGVTGKIFRPDREQMVPCPSKSSAVGTSARATFRLASRSLGEGSGLGKGDRASSTGTDVNCWQSRRHA